MKEILSKAILPAQISDFERGYATRINSISFKFCLGHLPAFVLLAYLNDTGPLDAVWLTALVLAGPLLAHRMLSNPRSIAVVYGMTAMLLGGLLVHFGQGPVQIEMHFYFFAQLAMLAVYGNPLVIIAAALTVAVHHFVLWLYLPSSVFNYDAPLYVVLIHAAFVVGESIVTCSIARAFFDNVIGLEKIVAERTTELRRVFDNVNQGLLTVDRQGLASRDVSAFVNRFFGEVPPDVPFADFVGTRAPDFGVSFEMGFEQLNDGMLPLELTLEQLPRELSLADSILLVEYTPIFDEQQEFSGLLVVMSDVTADRQAERLERERKQVIEIFERVMSDRRGFLEFMDESANLIACIVQQPDMPVADLKRRLHTLKGNTMLFGVSLVAELCHDMETRLEVGERPTQEDCELLLERWKATNEAVDLALGGEGRKTVLEVESRSYEEVVEAVRRQDSHDDVMGMLKSWRMEPTKVRLERLAEQARSIARRLNRGDIKVVEEDNGLALEPNDWASFWAAFVHVIRNAVDHGLEPTDEREAAGKSSVGTLLLATRLTEDVFEVSVKDDGRGIDWDRVRARAQERGLKATTHEELVEVLFSDGFSTATVASEYSGRGIGMGAVRQACEEMQGVVLVQSERGVGTCITFRFPASSMAGGRGDLALAS